MRRLTLVCICFLPLFALVNLSIITDLNVRRLPRGCTFNATTGEFYWKPDSTQVGEWTFEFRVQDQYGAYDTQLVNITVDKK